MSSTKVCNKCNIEKDTTEFYSGRRKCKVCHNKHKKKPSKQQIEEYRERRRIRYYENHEEEKENSREYKRNNKEKVKEYNKHYNKQYKKNRIQIDQVYRIKQSIRNLIKCSLYQKNFTKKSRTYKILGCTYEEFKKHIESQFEDWMSWDNYGIYNGKEKCGWEYDHIIPVSSVKSEEDIIKLNHYSNIQPLCTYVNRHIKRDTIDWNYKE